MQKKPGNKRRSKTKVIFYIITGMSGAGKSQAINCLEDIGLFCVDNLPVSLLTKFAELSLKLGGKLNRVAIGIDIRAGTSLNELRPALAELKRLGINSKIIFFDADDNTLIHRYSESRRKHPLGRRVLEGITQERNLLREIKSHADRLCDTSNLTLSELREILISWMSVKENDDLNLIVMSFGFKYGLPPDSDIVMDVRFLPNPNYIRGLKNLTGKDRKVKEFVLRQKTTKIFQSGFFNLIVDILPKFVEEGKSYLTISIGCTGGRHRSVVLAGKLAGFLASQGYPARVIHRDINR